ncbi:hypothetical protein ACIA03_24350 [Nocardioides sp. NPDC051685]|uniref:hypothetical protein n=1 Tax=Nocardioides sp. NPDC051685 TaxID=3364334 RepID=UPI00379E9617
MRDPIKDLESYTPDEPGVRPLPPAEVRRLGIRMRRRRRALLAGTSLAAVIAITVPFAFAALDRDSADPVPTRPSPSMPTPSRAQDPDATGETRWRTEIPEDFALLAGIVNDPEGSSPTISRSQDGVSVELCGETPWPAQSIDRLAGEDPALDHHYRRELLLFDTAAKAKQALAHVRNALASCPNDVITDGPVPGAELATENKSYPDESPRADETVTWTNAFTDASIGTDVFQFVRVGNAVAATRESSESNKDGVAQQVPMVSEASVHLVDQMCIFSADPCSSTPATDSGDGASAGTSDGLIDETNLVTADKLPPVDKNPWQQVGSQSIPTLTCQGGWLSGLDPADMESREFRIHAASADADLGRINAAVLAFGDKRSATVAYDTALGWLEDCPATHAESEVTIEKAAKAVTVTTSPDVSPVERAHQSRVIWQPPDFCPEGCDAALFEVATIAQVGSRVVFVSHAELAGPCPPSSDCDDPASERSWLDRVRTTNERVVGAAVWDLH